MNLPLTLSQAQVCEYTGYSVATVRMLERKGYLLRLPLTGRYARADVERLVEELSNANAAKRRTLGGPETDTPGEGMVEQIDALGDLDSAYICTDAGRPWKPNEMTRLWDRHLCPESLGGTTFMVDGRETRKPGAWTLHDLRHVAAGIIHELTQSPEAVRIILGHASTDMTLGYIAEASAKTGETLKLLDEAMRPKR